MSAPHLLAEMTTHEAAEAAGRDTVVVLPAGAVEQHGPGLPLGTDTIRAEAVAARVAGSMPGQVIVGPSLPVGISPHHLRFAGTVSLTTATFARLVREYVDSLVSHGWRRILVITGHGGNNAALGTVAQDLLRDHPHLEFAWTGLTAPDYVATMDVGEVHGHSGESETSQMLAVAPHLVRTDRLEAGTTALDQLDPLARLARRAGQPVLAVRYDQLSPNGVLGDPRRATREDGEAIVDLLTVRTVDFLKEWLDT